MGQEETPRTHKLCRILCYRSSKQGVNMGWSVRKGVLVLVCSEGWSGLRIQRGE